MGGGGGGYGGGGFSERLTRIVSRNSADAIAPVLIVTTPMESANRDEWRQDLRIMDNLLRERTVRDDGVAGPEAMGIKLLMTGGQENPPMYLEEYGAVFSYAVNFPLATAKKTEAKKPANEASPDSAWERAKREVEGSRNGPELAGGPPTPASDAEYRRAAESFQQRYGIAMSGGNPYGAAAGFTFAPPTAFDQAKVDALVNGVLSALPEAKNMRHLKESEALVVTISGRDDMGVPMRLTFKAKKADIDQAGTGTLTPEEFKTRVARNLGPTAQGQETTRPARSTGARKF